MTQKEVLRKLFNLLASELKSFDFELSYKHQGFIRRDKNAVFFYQLLIYNRTILKTGAKGFLIDPYIWIGVKEIEKYYKEITLNKELKTDVNFVTIGNGIGDLLANPDGIYRSHNNTLNLHIFKELDIQIEAEQLLKYFREVALPYCLNNASVEMVDKLINTSPHEYKVHTMNDNYRILKGIIAAKLNNNPKLNELIKIYDKQIVDYDMYNAVAEMPRLKAILPTISLECK